jgi:hypothetical protein
VFHLYQTVTCNSAILQLHSQSNTLIGTTSTANLTPSFCVSLVGADVSELDRSGSDGMLGSGELKTPTTGRVTDITGVGSPRPSFSSFGTVGLASPFAGDAGEGAEKQRRFEGENKYDLSALTLPSPPICLFIVCAASMPCMFA